jgi:hypothetical protein
MHDLDEAEGDEDAIEQREREGAIVALVWVCAVFTGVVIVLAQYLRLSANPSP